MKKNREIMEKAVTTSPKARRDFLQTLPRQFFLLDPFARRHWPMFHRNCRRTPWKWSKAHRRLQRARMPHVNW